LNKLIDLTGQKFGRLTVIKRVENDKWGAAYWLCKCNCELGKEFVVRGGHLRSGMVRSCGCLRIEIATVQSKLNKKYNKYDLSNKYGIGYTFKGEEFYFDLKDFDKIKYYCWYLNSLKYVVTNLNKKILFMHRLVTNCPDNMEVDHEFHEPWDNRKEFLRIVNRSQNEMNNSLASNNTSGVTGVSWHNQSGKWIAQIGFNNTLINLGYFDDFDEAVEVRKNAEIEYFGEYRYKEKTLKL